MEGSTAGVAGPLPSAPPQQARTPLRSRRSVADISHSSASPTSPSFTTRSPSAGRESAGRDRVHSTFSREDETVKHQLKILRGEVAKLERKLGQGHNPAPFGSSTPRNASLPDARYTRSTSPLPCGPLNAVSLNRALLSDDPAVNSGFRRSPSPRPATAPRSRGNGSGDGASLARLSAENPFFGSGASRERMQASASSAASGSGRVIATLQSDLLQTRSALESTRTQLRLSQRAVEHLTRQNDDLKESKERLSSENAGLSQMISRKERLLDEGLTRTKLAQSALKGLQNTHLAVVAEHTDRVRAHEDEKGLVEEARAQAESEYQSLREGMSSMSDGWRTELEWIKADVRRAQTTHERELDEARQKHSTLVKLFKAREAMHTDAATVLAALSASQREFAQTYGRSLAVSLKDVDAMVQRSDDGSQQAQALSLELVRMRRLIREHEASAGGGVAQGRVGGLA